ncbi:glycolate oxidase subunit GlcD [bacterium]|nr:MAG: glycolate oxidase subunit GlcD [bacterium]
MKIENALKEIYGKVYTGKEIKLLYSYDATGQAGEPEWVFFPENEEQVRKTVEVALEEKMPVIARGAGTGQSGGSLPVHGGVVMVFTRMKRIEVLERDMVCVVEPGAITGRIKKEVEKYGLYYPPDPASFEFSTIGGNVAEDAGGPRAVKYGVTSSFVLGLEWVDGTGKLYRWGGRNIKDVSGYPVHKLLCGSEGTLGIITKIYLKLIPLPPERDAVLLRFSTPEEAGEAVLEIMRMGISPSSLEYLSEKASSLIGLSGNYLMVELEGGEEVEEGIRKIRERFGGEEAGIWEKRKKLSPLLYRLAPIKINEDVVLPRSQLPEFLRFLSQLEKESGVHVVAFGHIGDGNLHTNVMCEKRETGERVVVRIMEEVVRRGGSISGEHGVGIRKKAFFRLQYGESERELMRRIKKVFDPEGILNPGKIWD